MLLEVIPNISLRQQLISITLDDCNENRTDTKFIYRFIPLKKIFTPLSQKLLTNIASKWRLTNLNHMVEHDDSNVKLLIVQITVCTDKRNQSTNTHYCIMTCCIDIVFPQPLSSPPTPPLLVIRN
uniref:Uncharacterized protein n=1 Tax=Timema cristinae TaxID=61476 RepID=A0A7R9D3Q0_TIMCR|nr:unnamed protein product [Timema cristinae]